jgi:hypothetical protein
MHKLTTLIFLTLLAVRCIAQQQNETTPEFANTEEIRLVVTQSERVFEQYKQSITMEAELPISKTNPAGVEKDRGVYDMAKDLIAALKLHPEGFHGVGGVLLLSALDDASRNAALCSGSAYSDTMEAVMSKSDIHAADDWIHVGLSCVDVSGYLYTVSESVEALLVRDLKAQQMLDRRAEETMNRCADSLKRCVSQSK